MPPSLATDDVPLIAESLGEGRAAQSGSLLTRARLRWALGLVAVAVFIFLGRHYYADVKRELAHAQILPVLGMIVLVVLVRLVNGVLLKWSVSHMGRSVGLIEMTLLNVLTTYTNLLIPRAGLTAPIFYLRHRHDVGYARGSSLMLPMLVLHVVAIGLFGLVGQWLLYLLTDGSYDWRVTTLFCATLAVGLAGTYGRWPLPARWQGRLINFARRAQDAWRQMQSDHGLIARLLALRILLLILRAVRLKFAFLAVGQNVGITEVLVSSLLMELAVVIAFTPDGMGFREAAAFYSAGILGCDKSAALSAAVLDRLVMTVFVVVVGQVAIWRLMRPLKKQAH